MTRRSELGLWTVLVIVAALAGLVVAGTPDLGGSPDPVRIAATDATDATDEPLDDPVDTTSTSALAPSTTSTTTTTSTTLPQLRPNEEVAVLVVNGTTVAGAAGRLTDQLAADGHPTLTPTSTSSFAVSEVWFTGDHGPEAAALADRIGVFPENVRVLPDDPGVTVGSADLVVVLGPDLAS